MREGAKRRLTGAVVVVALAVIFVPMLFEDEVQAPPPAGSVLPTAPDFASRFEPATLSPSEPVHALSDADLPLMDDDLSAVESEPPELPIPPETETDEPAFAPPLAAPGQISQPDRMRRADPASQPGRLNQSAARPAATPPKPATTKPATPATTAKPATPTKPAATPPAKTATPAKPEKAPNPRPSADGMPTWVVQVASLGSSQAAADLEKKLRGDGFSAFVEKAEVRGKTYYRVRVGPNANRASAEQTANKLRQKQKVEPLVQRYQR